ncbi:non-ribosomal peptide synthetase [Cyclobacterium jeungdonense]|uniref:Non-ribosomal peptide synthetase n=1 Tax=Cyclobacterium jeungdonense TaxID=708087 RepID=A0ABT8CAJ3_9BACT|nr:non-ribosomal peptide synthetase [Cyclobacterium jeungdonense]MDN3689555.1 non-ribosomal peptide synthetase [Cyclobacterium jeungdonense]
MENSFNSEQERPGGLNKNPPSAALFLNPSGCLFSSAWYPKNKTIVEILEEVAASCPEGIALVYEESSLTYYELNKRANQVAHILIKKGITTESLVPFCMEKSIDMMVTLFGILKSGAAYVPIDPNYPVERIRYILADIGAKILLVNNTLAGKSPISGTIDLLDVSSILAESTSSANPKIKPGPENLAYVIYTSGSTGKPKGVMVPHRGLLDHCFGLIERAALQDCTSYAVTAPIVFDAGHSLIHIAIIQASTIHLLSDSVVLDSEKFASYFEKHQIDCLKIVPSLWLTHSENGVLPLPSKTLIFGGEIFPVSILTLLRERNFTGDVFNHYGPTEASIGKTLYRVELNYHYHQVPIGMPYSNSFILLLNSNLETVAEGEAGEIYIGGEGISRGYLNSPRATASRFIPDFYSGNNGDLLYRTGDLAKISTDGNIIFIGRLDDQVKINGHRIEPGEIEKSIYQFESVKQIAVVAKSNPNRKTYLVAYFVSHQNSTQQNLKAKLKSQLPPHMIPQYWVAMEEMPLTRNGKIDKRALPDPEWKSSNLSDHQLPQTKTEKLLLGIWQKVLGWEKMGIRDNFFELGGDSLLIIRAIASIKKTFGKRLSVSDFFENPSISALSKVIANANAEVQVIEPAEEKAFIPLSFNQEALWIIHHSAGSVEYHLPMVFKISGELDVASLKASLKELVKRHLPLRTVIYQSEKGLEQQFLEPESWVLQEFISSQTEDEIQNDWVFKSMLERPFDLSKDYMIRAVLFHIQPQKYLLGVLVHHIAWDGWSTTLFKNQLAALYRQFKNDTPISLSFPELDYADFSIYQRNRLQGNSLDHSLQYWKMKLHGVQNSQLRTDFPSTSATTTTGASHEFVIDRDTVSKLKLLAKKQQATLFMVLLAGFNALLKRYSSQEDICVGTPVAGREHEGLDQLIGYFVNPLPIRTWVQDNTKFEELIGAVKKNMLEAFEHGHVPFSEIVKLSEDFRISGRNPIFQVLFVMQNNASSTLNLEGLDTVPLRISQQTSGFELTLEIKETEDSLQGMIEYRTSLFSSSTIAYLSDHYLQLLKSVTRDPQSTIDGINLLSDSENDFVLTNGIDFSLPDEFSGRTVIQLMAEQVTRFPENTAIQFNDERLSYRELELQSNVVANHLIQNGVGFRSFVPICLDNSPQMIIGILGILKAGAAYVPVDPLTPPERIQFILGDIRASWILTDKETEPFVREHFSSLSILTLDTNLSGIDGQNPNASKLIPSPENTAYLIYTSGTTGRPKGVMISHQGLFLFLFSRKKYYPDNFSIPLLTSFSFDASIPVIFGTLASGNTLVLGTSAQLKDPKELSRLLHRTESIICVPSFYRFLLTENLIPSGRIKRVILGGERVENTLVALHFDKNKAARLFNEYGPTEVTVWATVTELTSAKERITIGKPITHIKTYVLDPLGAVCPVGIAGELCISGDSLAIGYLNRPDLTAARFVPDPFSKVKNRRMYKTGDKARLLPDGNLEFLGRIDNQVKLRGFRIEPEEIEAILDESACVEKAIVTCCGESTENQKLVGHVIVTNHSTSLAGEQISPKLIAHLSERLPAHMVPDQWNYLTEMPLTVNGKIDRKKLSQADIRVGPKEFSAELESATEKRLKVVWKDLLKIDRIGVHDNFFQIGGHSLLAIRLINAIREQFDYEIKFADFFKHPTLRQLSVLIDGDTIAPLPTNSTKNNTDNKEFPLSFSQESLWLADRLEGSQQYHIPLVLKLKGRLHIHALEMALQAICSRHEVLRSVYRYTGENIHQVVRDLDSWHLEVKDISKENWDQQALDDFIYQCISKPFDLERDAMFRALLIRQSGEVNILVMTFHHIAFDGWSVGLFMQELENFYTQQKNKNKIDADPLPIQYVDYARWQRERIPVNGFEKKMAYWREKLGGLQPAKLAERKGPVDLPSTSGDARKFLFPTHISENVKAVAQQTGTTVYMVLMATLKTLLYQLTRQPDICVGTVVADRNHLHTDKLLGYFINTLPIRSQLNPGSTFTDFLQEVKGNCLEAFEYGDVPFEKIVAATQAERQLGSNPLFQVMFVLQNSFDEKGWQLDQLQVEKLETQSKRAKFDLLFTVSEADSGFKGLMEYKTSLFNSTEIEGIIEKYLQLLDTLFRQPSEPMDHLFPETNPTKTNDPAVVSSLFPDDFKPVQELIETAAANFGSKKAILSKNTSCTYKELNETANQLADLLCQQGVGRNDIVGVVMDRSIEMITSILAVLKAGAAYLPVDTDFPEERISYMLKDAAKVHITQRKYEGNFTTQSKEILWEVFVENQSGYSKQDRPSTNEAPDAAYIIYTSGSTGKPKGVILTHDNLYNFLKTVSQKPGISAPNQFLAVSSASFDIALLELILPFVHGAQVVILDQFERKDPRVILQYLRQKKADIMFATPTHWKMLLESGWSSPVENLQVISGGEALSKELANQLVPLCQRLWNIYGPTETTVFSTIKKIQADQPLITIGRPVLNTQIYILDEQQKPVPTGWEGELYISGKGVGKGYLNQPELTQEKFSPDPFQTELGTYMYKTGDRGKFLPDGEIQILGRIDNQIKLRGHRIELEEIEQAINRLGSVKESIVLFRNTSRNDKGLVAYLLLKNNGKGLVDDNKAILSSTIKDWKRKLSTILPAYMLPYDYVMVDHFPHTASGKVDRLKLPDPIAVAQEVVLLPETAEEKMVAEIWKEALGLTNIDITDNFFDLGGHSLIAVKVVTLIEKASGTLLPLSILFKYPTIQQLGAFLETKEGLQKEWKSLVPIQPNGSKAPIYMVHGAGLNVMPFQALAKYFDRDQPIFGLQSKGMDGEATSYESVEEIAASYIAEIRENSPSGEIILAGYSLGGIIAFEMARQLSGSSIHVKHLFLLDSYATFASDKNSPKNKLLNKIYKEYHKKSFDLKLLLRHPAILREIKSRSFSKKLTKLLVKLGVKAKESENPILLRINKIKAMHLAACRNYTPGFYQGEIVLLRARLRTKYFFDPETLGWKGCSSTIRIVDVEGMHSELFSEPNEGKLAACIKRIIGE